MIRTIKNEDFNIICKIVNDNWRELYDGYVNPALLSVEGCKQRGNSLKKDFSSHRLSEYVYEEDGKAIALLSFGNTADKDKAGAFEIWRIYISKEEQGKGIGGTLISFAEKEAKKNGYKEIVIWAFKCNVRAIAFYQKHGYMIDKEESLGHPYLATGVRLMKTL